MSLEFEWDDKKARENLKKHLISFEEAATIFGDGLSIKGRLLVVAHTNRDGVRIISAREATNHERKSYEKRN